MQYIKHYYVDNDNSTFCCESNLNPKYKRHPVNEYEGLNVTVWLSDSDNVDICLSELPDSTLVSTVVSDCGKNSVQVLNITEYNAVAIPYFEAQTLFGEAQEARGQGDVATAQAKEIAATVKIDEATAAIRAL